MAAKHKKNQSTTHQSGTSRRIRRRLPSEMQQSSPETSQPLAKKDRWKGWRPGKREKTVPKPGRKKNILFLLLLCLLTALLLFATASVVFLINSTKNDDLWLDLDQIPYNTETILYYTDQQTGQLEQYAVLPCTQNKVYVEGSQMPQHLKDAFVAVEDQQFYNHKGVSFKRTVFAMLNEFKHVITGSYIGGEGGRKQGASTIDQQLVKNLTRDDIDSNIAGYLRKAREIWRALRLDKTYDKQTILEAYLNTISFTGNTAGVQAESQKLFGKDVDQLTLAESASLAAITRNPSRYNPVKNPEPHLERRNYVLKLMLEQQYISQAEYDQAIQQELVLANAEEPKMPEYITSYFTDAVIDSVIAEFAEQRSLSRKQATNLLYNGGLRIHTTVVPALQDNMQQVMESASLFPRPAVTTTGPLTDEEGQPLLDQDGKQLTGEIQVYPQAAMVSLDYDGGVSAVVGGLGPKEISRGFNRGTSAIRQVGSTMKPIGPYAVAFENNDIHWSSPFLDEPVRQQEDEKTGEMVDWPQNVNKQYSGKQILVREAMARSVNTIAVRVGEAAGIRNIYNFVKRDLEIPTIVRQDAKPGPMILGSSTYGISPVEMAKAFAMFGNQGHTPTIHYFTQITNGTDRVLLETSPKNHQSISPDTAYVMNRLLREVVTGNGTASGMSVPGEMDSIGKTGTTSDNRDHWFIGLTPYYVTACWYGYDENLPLLADNRNHPPTLAWRRVMQQAQQGLQPREFPVDHTVVKEAYCTVSGAAAGPFCPSAIGYYRQNKLPKQGCQVHGG